MKIFKLILQKVAHCFHFFWYCVIYAICKICLPNKVIGKENIEKDDEARVFISNHLQIYGPVITHISFPIKKKATWSHEYMLDKDLIEKQLFIGFVEVQFKWIPKFIKKGIAKLLKHLIIYILKYRVHAVSISRDDTRKLVKTLQETSDRLNNGYAMMIFPELDYQETGLGEISSSFTLIAKYYYKNFNKKVSFYPVYVNKKKKRTFIGKPIKFNPDDENYSENISNYIVEQINDMSK